MFDVCLLEAKNRLFEFDHQQMNTFKFVRCSKYDVRVCSIFDEMVYDPSLLIFLKQIMSSFRFGEFSRTLFSSNSISSYFRPLIAKGDLKTGYSSGPEIDDSRLHSVGELAPSKSVVVLNGQGQHEV